MLTNIFENVGIALEATVKISDHGGSGVERSNHTTATEICPYVGRCCCWHTSGGVVLHPHQLAGGDVRGTNQSHGVLPWRPSNHTTPSAASVACYEIKKRPGHHPRSLLPYPPINYTQLILITNSVTFRANTFPISHKLFHIIVYRDLKFSCFFFHCKHKSIINVQIIAMVTE